MAAHILVIQFRSDDAGLAAEQNSLTRVLGQDNTLVFKNALKNEVDWSNPKKELAGFDGVILPGSAELYFDGGHHEEHKGRVITSKVAEQSKPFAQYLVKHDMPTLGICFGHQLLGYAVGADVQHSTIEGKTGTIRVRVGEEGEKDPLFNGLSKEFPAQYTHKDAVCSLPHGATVLASNPERCRFAALRFAPHVYSVQFHPERSREDCIAGAKRTPEYMPYRTDAKKLFQDSKESERVLVNFASLAARRE